MKRILRITAVFLWGMVSNGLPLAAQAAAAPDGIGLKDAVPWVLALGAICFGIYQYVHRKRDAREQQTIQLQTTKKFQENLDLDAGRTGEDIYRAALREKLGYIEFLGSPDLESTSLKLEETFVSLTIDESWSSGRGCEPGPAEKNRADQAPEARKLTPEQVVARAFERFRLLLILGDPGSGKTTLMKYYCLHCLEKTGTLRRRLGFSRPVFPLYLPLRDLIFVEGDEPAPLAHSLGGWAKRHHLDISPEQFSRWLGERETLVLLDGLDELDSAGRRRRVCRWVGEMSVGLTRANFIVTSRATGYRKLDGIEFQLPHLRAEIRDFSLEQQELFLHNWFRASYLSVPPPRDTGEAVWQRRRKLEARHRADEVAAFLKDEENKTVRRLAAVPMLLEIMAVLWRDRQLLPRTRNELYDAALNYLLEYRARVKGLEPLVSNAEARRVLPPAALWMQEDKKADEVPKEEMHDFLTPRLKNFAGQPSAMDFCAYLRDRAGLIADHDRERYIFRHKSFREFLAGIQLREEAHAPLRLERLAEFFKAPWWEETLVFFMCRSNGEIFNNFMRMFFSSPASRELDAHQRKLLLRLVKDAPEKPIEALTGWLNAPGLENTVRQYLLDCLKTVGTPEAVEAVKQADKGTWDKITRGYAADLVSQLDTAYRAPIAKEVARDVPVQAPPSFRNPFESNVEYIKIPGGTFTYSVTEEKQTVDDFYLCKYPVTNARYRGFIDYISGKETELTEILPPKSFSPLLLEFAGNNGYDGVIAEGFSESLGKDPSGWKDKLRSGYEDNKKFNGADQPVVAISWYAARSYCFWLSCLEAADKDKTVLGDIRRLSEIYRLPDEMEWEWAAGGNPDGTVRAYPWPGDKGEPTSELANYNGNIGATTPVGNYTAGATPLGLMDMAGNVWEWMDNYSDNDKDAPVLRGGSWYDLGYDLRCSARFNFNHPHLRGFYVGLRPLRPSLIF